MKVLAEDDAAFASADTGGRRNHIQCQHFLMMLIYEGNHLFL